MENLEFLEARIQFRIDFVQQNLNERLENRLKHFEKYGKALVKAFKTGSYGTANKLKEAFNREDRDSFEENQCPNAEFDQVKTEKLSIASTVHDEDEMPAPTIIPPKKKQVKKEKKSTLKKVKQEPNSDSETRSGRGTRLQRRTSDVILCEPNHSVVVLSDDGADSDWAESAPTRSTRTRTKAKEAVENSSETIRSTRTRTRKAAVESETECEKDVAPARVTRTKTKAVKKRERSSSANEKTTANNKRSKSNSLTSNDEAPNVSGRTEYEDAHSELDSRTQNSTFALPEKSVQAAPTQSAGSKKNNMMNETIVVAKPTVKQPTLTSSAEDLLTDDESMEEQRVSPQKAQRTIKNNKKEVFSPFDSSPVKKKVEAFEKYKKNEVQPASSKTNTSRVLNQIGENKGNVKEKAKCFTPVAGKQLYKANTSSTGGISRYVGYKSAINDSMSKSKTAMRSPLTQGCRTDFKLRELKRQEKEKELQKKELAKRAMSEDRKKKYEEKILKVQQQKDAYEREKLKAWEAQKLKDEKYKLLQQLKEEKFRQMREENERKRLLAKQRAEERKREEEAQRLAAQEKVEHKNKAQAGTFREQVLQKSNDAIPIYLRNRAPLLPTVDCYDSDEEENKREKPYPNWTRQGYLDAYTQEDLGHKIKNTFFCCQNQTIDLREMFERIDPRKLKRTSSANWGKAPRFTILPHFEEE